MFWYDSAAGIKARFEESGKFDDLKEQLEETGIIYEGDFEGLVTSGFIERGCDSLEELFLDSNVEYGYSNLAIEIPGEGWMYFLYDTNMLSLEEAKNKAILHFS